MFVRPPTCTLNFSFQMFSVYFTPDLPEGRAKAGEAGQFASGLKIMLRPSPSGSKYILIRILNDR